MLGGGNLDNEEMESVASIGSKGANVASFILIGKFTSIILTGIAFIIVARVLGPSVYGVYTLIIGTMGILTATGDFGISTGINKFTAELIHSKKTSEIGALVFNSLLAVAVIGLIIAAIIFSISGFLSMYILHTGAYKNLVEIAAFYILFTMLYDVAYGALVGIGSKLASVQALQSGSQAAISITLALLGFGAAAPILGLEVGLAIGFVAAIAVMHFSDGIGITARADIKKIKKIFSFSIPVGASSFLGGVANNIGIVMLGVVSTTVIAGNFGVAAKIASLLDLIIGSIYMASIPMFSHALLNKNDKKIVPKLYTYAFYMALVFVAPMVAYMAVFAKPFSYVLFSGLYKMGPEYIALVSIGTLIWLLGYYASALMISAGEVKKVLKYNMLIFVVELIAILLLVPRFSGTGLVLSIYFASYGATTILFFLGVRRLFGVHLNWNKVGRILLANIIAAALAYVPYFLFPTSFIPVLVIGLAIEVGTYPILLSVTGAMTKKDFAHVKLATESIPFFGRVIKLLVDYATAIQKNQNRI